MAIENKTFPLEIKAAEMQEDGTFVGLASTYGNVDQGNDVVDRGAFTKTLNERGVEVPLLWSHDSKIPVGLGTLEDSPSGLVVRGKLNLEKQIGRDVYSDMKMRIVKGLSIGFETINKKMNEGVRHLTELKLYEVSLCLFPMNEQASVFGVKHAEEPEGKIGRRHSAATASRLQALAEQASAISKEIQTLLESEAAASTSEEGAVAPEVQKTKANGIEPEQFHSLLSSYKNTLTGATKWN